jgi:hypothetical protein
MSPASGARWAAIPSLAALLALLAAGCATSPPTPRPRPTVTHTAPAGLSTQQVQTICTDLNDWLPVAVKEDQPRFTPTLTADQAEAAGTPLGNALATLSANLQQVNGLAFEPSPPGYTGTPLGLGALQRGCAGYGVTVTLPGAGG